MVNLMHSILIHTLGIRFADLSSSRSLDGTCVLPPIPRRLSARTAPPNSPVNLVCTAGKTENGVCIASSPTPRPRLAGFARHKREWGHIGPEPNIPSRVHHFDAGPQWPAATSSSPLPAALPHKVCIGLPRWRAARPIAVFSYPASLLRAPSPVQIHECASRHNRFSTPSHSFAEDTVTRVSYESLLVSSPRPPHHPWCSPVPACATDDDEDAGVMHAHATDIPLLPVRSSSHRRGAIRIHTPPPSTSALSPSSPSSLTICSPPAPPRYRHRHVWTFTAEGRGESMASYPRADISYLALAHGASLITSSARILAYLPLAPRARSGTVTISLPVTVGRGDGAERRLVRIASTGARGLRASEGRVLAWRSSVVHDASEFAQLEEKIQRG
ncbi:hypothetical protein B0H13DRAFT_2342381 [Mycena leptocephala]|nr:hypothetical protein B0H13DRAFT_2342381 [Mycena leptocephala]